MQKYSIFGLVGRNLVSFRFRSATFSISPVTSDSLYCCRSRSKSCYYSRISSPSIDEILNQSCRSGLLLQLNQPRLFHSTKIQCNQEKELPATATVSSSSNDDTDKKPSSKVEESVKVIKEELKDKAVAVVPKRSIWKRIEDEILHYYHGFRLLILDTKLSIGLINRVLNGKSLSRREHRQLIRTTSDLFRLVPFSVFIIVPFMELLLPVVLKFFPGMLPSTFQTKNDRENKMKAQLKVKLEMAKFLQQTLDDMSLQSKEGHSSEKAKEFAAFFIKIRTSGAEVTTEEIVKFSKLFEDEITLDSLSRQQLKALCHVLEIPALGNDTFLRFQLRMKLRSLMADDKTIEFEGIESLNVTELQMACKARGMRAVGVDEERLRRQLSQWLQLSLHEKIPPSLLLLSRAMYLPEDLPASVQLQATISALPEAAATLAKAAIGEREGKIDHKTRIEIIQEEERTIKEERQDALIEELREGLKQDLEREELTKEDMERIEGALDSLGAEKKQLYVEKEELQDLKAEMADYKEDIQDLATLTSVSVEKPIEVRESKAAKRLYNKVNKMISNMDTIVEQLHKEETKLISELKGAPEAPEAKKTQLIATEELIDAIQKLQKVSDPARLDRIADVIENLDVDRDGHVEVEDVLKVIELIGRENVKLNSKQIAEIVDMMSKEENVELRKAKPVEKPKSEPEFR